MRTTGEPPSRTAAAFWQAQHYYGAPEPLPDGGNQEFFNRFLPRRPGGSALEIGACPGSNLLTLALSHGYRPVALDILPTVQKLPELFRNYGVENLEVIEADFLSLGTDRKYDVVMSFGFIEHFNNAEEVLRKHWDLVKEDGFLIVSLPIFRHLQMVLRRLVFTPEKMAEALRTHNTAIMDMRLIRNWCERLPGAVILECGYFGNMHTWLCSSDSYVRPSRRWILRGWKVASLLPRLLNISCRWFSPHGLVVLRRTSPAA